VSRPDSLAGLDAVTVDAYGTLVRLADPTPALGAALAAAGVERTPEEVAAAFAEEVRHYRPRSLRGRDEPSLQTLREECVGIFLAALRAELGAAAFVPSFIGALVFEPIDGAAEVLDELRGRGLRLAVVANWDCALRGVLEQLGLAPRFETIVASAEAGAEKPDPEIFRVALERLGVEPARALHIGDEDVDERGAAAAGMRFAPAPLTALLGRVA
jgi:HAD superfamily hydrolase (TIGR01509 family)